MAGLPVVDLDAVGGERGIGGEQAGRLDVDDEGRALVQLRQVAREHDADLVGEDFLALVVDDAAAVAVAVEAEPDVGAGRLHRLRHRVQHVQVFGVRVVARKGVVELAVERHDLDAERREQLRRKGAGRAVAAGRDDLHLARELRPVRQVGDVAGREVGHEFIGAAGLGRIIAADARCRAGAPISSGPKVTGRAAPILTPVQPLSLCEAVTIATAGASSANWAK